MAEKEGNLDAITIGTSSQDLRFFKLHNTGNFTISLFSEWPVSLPPLLALNAKTLNLLMLMINIVVIVDWMISLDN